jgi:NAD(P)-dependent dehydrogenase (short-subunit alcohol dehydrogenase family)
VAAILGVLALLKLYVMVTNGRHKIKQSLKGKVVVMTGGTAGLGKETVRELAAKDATIHVLARDLTKAERVIGEIRTSTGNQDIHIHRADLSNFETIRAFAKKFLETKSPIHLLINNAGLGNEVKKVTVDGNEETMQANHLSHFLLTNLLLDRIKESAPSRIINVSSIGHTFVKANEFDLHDMNFEKQNNPYKFIKAYCWSKLMNILFTRELARRLYGKGVTVNCLHPGGVRSELTRNGSIWNPYVFIPLLVGPILLKSENEGAQTTLYLATADEVANVSGHYFSDCALTKTTLLAVDDQLASELWTESEKKTGIAKA